MAFIPEEKGIFGKLKDSVTRVFVPPQDPKEAVQKWTRQIRSEARGVERSILEIQRDKKKAEMHIKQHAKANDIDGAKVIAREVVNSNKAITRLHTQKAHMLDMEMALRHQLAMVKVAGALNKSAEVMKIVNDLMKVGSLQGSVREMAKEMMKAGLIEEMMEDVMDQSMGTEEEEVDDEVNRVLQDVAGEQLAKLPSAGRVQVAEPEKSEEEKAAEYALLEQLAAGKVPEGAQAIQS